MTKSISIHSETLKIIFDKIYIVTMAFVFIGSIILITSILRIL